MNILVLEDDKERHKFFRKMNSERDVLYIAETVMKAIEIFEKYDIEMMFLDHDLGGRTFVDSEEQNTGYQFLKYLMKHHASKLSRMGSVNIYIHSMNAVGAKKMQTICPWATYLPFHMLKANSI